MSTLSRKMEQQGKQTQGKLKMWRASTADVCWEDGVLRSRVYNDIYANPQDALGESHYVFLEQNELPQRIGGFTDEEVLRIGELGFGTGLNAVLVALEMFRAGLQRRVIHFISLERFLLAKSDLERYYEQLLHEEKNATFFKDRQEQEYCVYLVRQLLEQWPTDIIPGFHHIQLGKAEGPRLRIQLGLGDAAEVLPEYPDEIGTWFLDGFAPRQNKGMWRDEFWSIIAQKSKACAYLSTFSCVGDVRRSLISAGFTMQKVKGFGKKREMLVGRFYEKNGEREKTKVKVNTRQVFTNAILSQPIPETEIKNIAIIGGGIAGTAAAAALTRSGKRCTIFDSRGIGQAASGNARGLLEPVYTRQYNAQMQWFLAAFAHAKKIIKHINDDDNVLEYQQNTLIHHDKKLKKYTHKDAQALAENWFWSTWIRPDFEVGQYESDLAISLSPQQLCQQLYDCFKPYLRKEKISRVEKSGQNLIVINASGIPLGNYDAVLWCVGHHIKDMFPILSGVQRFSPLASNDLQSMRGIVGRIPYEEINKKPFVAAVTVLPNKDRNDAVVAGLHQLNDMRETISFEDKEMLKSDLHSTYAAINNSDAVSELESQTIDDAIEHFRVAWRASSADRMPLVGALPDLSRAQEIYGDLSQGRYWRSYPPIPIKDHQYIIAGLGGRGLISAFLAAEIVAAQIDGCAIPIEKALQQAIHPGRFAFRAYLRQ